MSTDEEIQETYWADIDHKTNIVRQRQGIEAFLPRNMVNGTDGFSIYNHPDTDGIVCSDRRDKCRSKRGRRTR